MESFKKSEETSWTENIVKEMKEKGFEPAGKESLARDVFDSTTAEFVMTLEQTEEKIKQTYGDKWKYEVELVLIPSEKIKELLNKGFISEEEADAYEIPPIERVYLVFTRPLSKTE